MITSPAYGLPAGKSAAVCFSVDDVHPGTSQDPYEAGGDLERGSLGRLQELQQRHPSLKAALCVTPDWRLDSLIPNTRVLRHVPFLSPHVHWTKLHPRGRFRLDRHPQFAAYLNGMKHCEIVPHGLTHSHRGPRFAVEFQHESRARCETIVQSSLDIFHAAKINYVRGYVPPAWNAPPALIDTLERMEFAFVSSARDLTTAPSRDAVTAMSGLNGMSLMYPQLIGPQKRLVHLSCNYQASSSYDRALRILDLGGVLHIKAHIFKSAGGHVMRDGLDDAYCHYLDALFSLLAKRFGDSLWWAHLSEVAAAARSAV